MRRSLLVVALVLASPLLQGHALSAPQLTHGAADDIGRYLELLAELRGGNDAAAEPLRALGQHLCEIHARCDTLAVAEYYTGLTPEERAQGLADEQEFFELRRYVVDAGRKGLDPDESWDVLRGELEEELADFAERVEPRADFAPAARAWALLARLEFDHTPSGPEERRARLDGVTEHCERSIALFARAGQVTPRLEPLLVLGRVARARREVEGARAFFERCLELADEVGNDDYREGALLALVALARDAGDVAQVDRLLSRLAAFRSPAESWRLAREHANRLLHADEPEAALGFLVNHPPRDDGFDTDWHALLATAFLRSGDLVAARREIEAFGSSRDELAQISRARIELADGNAERVFELLGAPRTAPPDAQAASSSETLARSWSARSQVDALVLVGEAWLALGQPQNAIPWLRAALERANVWQALHDDERAGSVIGEWVGVHTVVLLARSLAAAGRGLEAAVVIEDFQSRRLRPLPIDAQTLRDAAARHGAGLVTWAVGAEAGVVAHVSASGEAWAGPMQHGRHALEQAVRRLREATLLGSDERVAELAAQIARELFPPELRQRLRSAPPGARLLLLPHGPLEAMPVALLPFEGALLDDRFTLLVSPGLTSDEPGGEDELRFEDWALLGSPLAADGERLLLPGASRELAALSDLYPDATHLTGAAFVGRALRDALVGDAALHIATHMVPGPDCSGTRLAPVGLQLSEGEVLCAEEIFALRPQLPLVVLTACETAGGRFIDAEGLHGIGRAFLEAGTRNLLVTLWPVEDEAAREFALTFHGALRSGASPADAARRARRILRERGRAAADWAVFRFMGRD